MHPYLIFTAHQYFDTLKKKKLTLYHTITTFNDPEIGDFFENIVGKGENAGNQHFLLFPQCFLPIQRTKFCRLQMLSIWTSVKKWSFGKELKKTAKRFGPNRPG